MEFYHLTTWLIINIIISIVNIINYYLLMYIKNSCFFTLSSVSISIRLSIRFLLTRGCPPFNQLIY